MCTLSRLHGQHGAVSYVPPTHCPRHAGKTSSYLTERRNRSTDISSRQNPRPSMLMLITLSDCNPVNNAPETGYPDQGSGSPADHDGQRLVASIEAELDLHGDRHPPGPHPSVDRRQSYLPLEYRAVVAPCTRSNTLPARLAASSPQSGREPTYRPVRLVRPAQQAARVDPHLGCHGN